MGFLKKAFKKFADKVGGDDDDDGDGGDEIITRDQFEESKPDEMRKDIRMISGCEDVQTSADVSNVGSFNLPDPAGRAGGACTSTLLKLLYADEQELDEDLTFTEVLDKMREHLDEDGYTQIPQLSSMNPIDMDAKFDLVPDHYTGTKRAVMIGINYVGDDPGELSGCHNDVLNMMNYITNCHGFEEENIVVLMDDGENIRPTYRNIINAYKRVISESEPGDSIFLHYSGHGTKIRDDDDGEEEDGYDEALCPVDYPSAGVIRDDDLYDIIVKGVSQGVFVVSLMDCCHSGSILDLPYMFKADGSQTEMKLDPGLNLAALVEKICGELGPMGDLLQMFL